MKHTNGEKLSILKEYFEDKASVTHLVNKHKIDKAKFLV